MLTWRANFYKISRQITFHTKYTDDNGVTIVPLDVCVFLPKCVCIHDPGNEVFLNCVCERCFDGTVLS